jgi:hypothetical protein
MNWLLSPPFFLAAGLWVGCAPPSTSAEDLDSLARAHAQNAAFAEKKAHADAQKRDATDQAEFEKARESHRLIVQSNLEDLDSKIADLETKANGSTGKPKADLDAKLTSLHTQRAAFDDDFKALESSPASTWAATRLRLDQSFADLKAAVAQAA